MNEIEAFFDSAYASTDRYWWRVPHAHSTVPEDHADSLITQQVLRFARARGSGRALDLGAGEGHDAVRLALLGWKVEAVEISHTGAKKIESLADALGVEITVHCANAQNFEPSGAFDLVLCNGLLHYVDDKNALCQRMQEWTVPGGANAIALWSDFTPVPECHHIVPTFPDQERGAVVSAYEHWKWELLYVERNRVDLSHNDMPAHVHSYIKLIAVKRVST